MGVIAIKVISGTQVQHEFECGAFDLMMESDPGNGWAEVSRDCDAWVDRWGLYPYASGNKGRSGAFPSSPASDPRLPFRKFFPAVDDEFTAVLDFSDINNGILPLTPCSQMFLYQNGKKLPCEAYTVNYGTSALTVAEAWRVPGAAYEAQYFAPLWVDPGT